METPTLVPGASLFFSSFFPTIYLATSYGLWFAERLLCAFFVYRSAQQRSQKALGISAVSWSILAAAGGLWGLAAFWLIEHSSLRKNSYADKQSAARTGD
jgi:hypothetical protein